MGCLYKLIVSASELCNTEMFAIIMTMSRLLKKQVIVDQPFSRVGGGGGGARRNRSRCHDVIFRAHLAIAMTIPTLAKGKRK